MFANIFIDRPRLAFVVSIFLMLAGALCVFELPVAEYPSVAPPTILVMASYPGASSGEIADTVAAPIESEINSVQDLIYYSSTSDNAGNYTLYVTFKSGTDEDMALVNVNNAVKLAEHSLPTEVVANGLTAVKATADMVCAIAVRSSNPAHTLIDVSNYADIHLKDAIARIEGVGNVQIYGEMKYAMRLWLDPEKMRALGISPTEVAAAVSAQNVQAAAGSVGAEYAGRLMQFKVTTKGRLATPEEFAAIVVRSSADARRIVRVKDIARVELGSEKYEGLGRYMGEPSVTLAVSKLPSANALDVMRQVRETLADAEARFPDGMRWDMAYDTSRFVKASMREIVETLLLTFLLVVVITWVFLQSWRATLIPAVTIPVSLVGTFLFMRLFGMSINTLTMFALILVIGSVVDDAIVVTESVVRMIEEGMTPRDASRETMRQISGALVATTLVVLAVYAPLAFAGGLVGTIYLQFSVVMCVALLLSLVNALTLSPALAALVLKKPPVPNAAFRAFNRALDKTRNFYSRASGFLVRHIVVTVVLYLAFLAFDAWIFRRIPGGFLPEEDKGTLLCEVILPPGAALARTEAVVGEVARRAETLPGVKSVCEIPGHSVTAGEGENVAMLIVEMRDWAERPDGCTVWTLQDALAAATADIPDAEVMALVPPAIEGIGESGGVMCELLSTGGATPQQLAAAASALVKRLEDSGKASFAFTSFEAATPMLRFDLDRDKAEAMGVKVADVFAALQTQLGSYYINDFNKFSRTYQVKMQGAKESRANVAALGRIYVAGRGGASVPLSALGSFRWVLGSRQTTRFNMFPAAMVSAQPAPGVATGEVIAEIERIVRDLGTDYAVSWIDMTYQERQNEGRIVWLLALSLLMAYLFLVAQYESWTVPVPVILVVAVAVAGALAALGLSGMAMNIYCQLGLLMLVGLTAKTAILMVEYAKQRNDANAGTVRAALTGLRIRFRSVQMTALSFVIGVAPLLFATGAGAGARLAVGVTTFWGMLAATLLGLLLIPPLYVLLRMKGWRGEETAPSQPPCFCLWPGRRCWSGEL